MNEILKSVERVIGFDSHPDSFTAAILRGPTPAAALVEKTFNKVPLAQLQSWAKKHTSAQDLFVLEASGNSFQVVRSWPLSSAKPKYWRVAIWASSRRPTPTTTRSAPCALARLTWPARPKRSGFPTPKPRSGGTGSTLTARPPSAPLN